MKLLVTGAWKCTDEQLNSIKALGNEIVFMQYEKDDLPCGYDWPEAIICNGLFLSHPIEKFTNLRYIQLTSVGFDRVPMDYVKEHNIEIYNARGVYSVPMAEFALCGVLEIYKQSRFFLENQKQRLWEKHRSLWELEGETVLIMGCGSVGTECAKRFNAFGCRVMGIDLYPREDSNYGQMYGLDMLDGLLPVADVIVLTLPLTEDTFHLIDRVRLSGLKNNAVLVNIARGAIIDTEALIDTVDNIGGAVLDVFEEEPLSENSPLWTKDNVIITPHNSFVGDKNSERLSKVIFDNLGGIKNK